MNNTQQARALVSQFIATIWNRREFDKLAEFFHPNYHDYSLPDHFLTTSQGTLQWITALAESFEHQTHIEQTIGEDDKVVLKVSMQLTHIGEWRGIIATGAEVTTVGYRLFQLKEGKIVAHWALIDGESIEKKLKNQVTGCRLPT